MSLEMKNLGKSFDAHVVFRDFSAVFEEGVLTCIMGESGRGKTTLMHILLGLVPPDSGMLCGFAGKRMAAVFQEDRLCDYLSAGANIRLACREAPPQQIEAHLEQVGLAGLSGQKTGGMSGGMKRRVAVVRAVLYGADILLLDEPFKGMDVETKARVATYIRRFTQGKTVLLVTHDGLDVEALGAQAVLAL